MSKTIVIIVVGVALLVLSWYILPIINYLAYRLHYMIEDYKLKKKKGNIK